NAPHARFVTVAELVDRHAVGFGRRNLTPQKRVELSNGLVRIHALEVPRLFTPEIPRVWYAAHMTVLCAEITFPFQLPSFKRATFVPPPSLCERKKGVAPAGI